MPTGLGMWQLGDPLQVTSSTLEAERSVGLRRDNLQWRSPHVKLSTWGRLRPQKRQFGSDGYSESSWIKRSIWQPRLSLGITKGQFSWPETHSFMPERSKSTSSTTL